MRPSKPCARSIARRALRLFDEVILAVGQQPSLWLARVLHLDPVHQLQRRFGKRLVTFADER